MKALFSIVVLVSLLNASSTEIDIMEEVVDDITKLKNEYKVCQDDLKNRFVKTDYKELEKYKILLRKEQDKNSKMIKDMKWFTQTIETLENDLNQKKQELSKIKSVKKKKIKIVHKVIKLKEESIKFIKPVTFRLKNTSIIYNKIDGIKVLQWSKNRTFTSNIKSENWVKITGYFVGRKWKKAQKDMWIKSSQVFRRN